MENIWHYSPSRLVERKYGTIHQQDRYEEYMALITIQTGRANMWNYSPPSRLVYRIYGIVHHPEC